MLYHSNNEFVEPLTEEQAIILTGFTGITCIEFSKYQKDAEQRLGRPIFTHEFGSETFVAMLKELYKSDFMYLVTGEKS